MKIRNYAIAVLAAVALSGCVTGYGYRGGVGDYYYGQPSVDYYGYGSAYGGYGYSGYGYGYDYGYGYPYGYGYYPGYYYPGYPYYPPRPHNPRPNPRPDRPGYQIPDNGVRYPSRAQGVLRGGSQSRMAPGQVPPSVETRYPSRYERRMPQVPSNLESRGGGDAGSLNQPRPPSRTQPIAPRFEPRADVPPPSFQSRPSPVRQSVPSRSSFRDRDRGREQAP